MTWNLFIDDERWPSDVTWGPSDVQLKYKNDKWVVFRSVIDAVVYMSDERSFPQFISFDHDLGNDVETGYDFAKILVDDALTYPEIAEFQFPDNFDFYVHSMNPIGKVNIEKLLRNYLKHVKENAT